ncbi:hypothetical protein [Natranaeroarchaeum sulfidigenes]|uniref:hypothetical protein n=1 Tax=Natranaeroarchaeum sulfidigenes TaxID=2784880 RepID=UPI001EE53767|nr:hypothetical protein [Natranaeroarchaeum sulfidigenes]
MAVAVARAGWRSSPANLCEGCRGTEWSDEAGEDEAGEDEAVLGGSKGAVPVGGSAAC